MTDLPKGIRIRGGSYVAYLTIGKGRAVRRTIGPVMFLTVEEAYRKRAAWEEEIEKGTYRRRGHGR
jgi:hypothetical protein